MSDGTTSLGGVKELSIPGFTFARLFDEVPSTMTVARASLPELMSSAHAPSGDKTPPCAAVVMAQSQTAGRGRQGRVWNNSRGAFMGTFLFECSLPISLLGGYSLAVGVAVADALDPERKLIKLKWPNDLMVAANGDAVSAAVPVAGQAAFQKVGGVLIEVVPFENRNVILAGIGINLSDSPSDLSSAASLRTLGPAALGSVDVATKIGVALLTMHTRFIEAGGFAPYRQQWQPRSCLGGVPISVEIGERTVTGTYSGITDSGALRLLVADQIEEVHAGHLVAW